MDWFEVSCPARIDLFGGWTDTPPICFHVGGAVVNIAVTVDGKRPIRARGRRIQETAIKLQDQGGTSLVLKTLDDLNGYSSPLSPGALLKACLIGSKFIRTEGIDLESQLQDGGIEVLTHSDLPHGSGLGTSSILAACVIVLLWKLKGEEFGEERSSLLHCVLDVESLLTTGGGWQDQVGGVVGGAKIGRCPREGEFLITYDSLQVDAALLSSHLLLIYTGKSRLAKNLLQTVLNNWQQGEMEVVRAFERLLSGVDDCAAALEKGDLQALGQSLDQYWTLKKILATDAEPSRVRKLIETIKPFVHGASLAGAGGGGFLVVILKEELEKERIAKILKESEDEELRCCTVHTVSVDMDGLRLEVSK